MRKSKFFVSLLLVAVFMVLALGTVNAQERTKVRWFVGLGAGSDADKIPLQQAVVDEFNASQSDIELVLEVVDNT